MEEKMNSYLTQKFAMNLNTKKFEELDLFSQKVIIEELEREQENLMRHQNSMQLIMENEFAKGIYKDKFVKNNERLEFISDVIIKLSIIYHENKSHLLIDILGTSKI